MDFLITPFAWIMRGLYGIFNNYALALVFYALIIKIVLFPLSMKQQKNSLQMVRMRPYQEALMHKYGNNKEKYNMELQKLYQREGYNPMSSCLPLLIQLPLIIVIYKVVRRPLTYIQFGSLTIAEAAEKIIQIGKNSGYAKIADVTVKNLEGHELSIMAGANAADITIKGNDLFGFIDLSAVPNFKQISWLWLIPLVAGLTSYLVSWLSQKLNAATQDPQMQNGCSGKTMTYMMPLMSLYFCFIMPCSLGLYWIVGNVLSLGQSLLLHKMYDPQKVLDEVQAKIDKEKEVKKAKRSAAAEKKAAALAAGKKKNK